MSPEKNNHRVDYLEIVVRDIAAARKFYSTVFGWVFTDYGPDYTSFADGRLRGGFRTDKNAQPSANPLIVIFATDLEATETAVKAAGGKISTAIHDFPGGRRFHFTDSNAIEFAVWSDRRKDGSATG